MLNSDFEKGRVDTSIWRPGWFAAGVSGPINRFELACYDPSNVSVSAQRGLRLAVTRTPSECDGRRQPYTGAVLSTNPDDGRAHGGFAYRYGVLQAKVYLPAAAGSMIANWPTLVTLGQHWPRDGEDDIIENLDGLMCAHFHSIGYAPGGDLGGCDPGFRPGWAIVASDWRPGSVTWYYNGVEIARASKGITSQPMYIVLVDTVSAKARQLARSDAMGVAYVRVWQELRPAGRSSSTRRRSSP